MSTGPSTWCPGFISVQVREIALSWKRPVAGKTQDKHWPAAVLSAFRKVKKKKIKKKKWEKKNQKTHTCGCHLLKANKIVVHLPNFPSRYFAVSYQNGLLNDLELAATTFAFVPESER